MCFLKIGPSLLSLIVLELLVTLGSLPPTIHAACSSDRLLLYQVTMQTHWSKDDFPKDYPKFRPLVWIFN